jgi:small GTP-binding protein
MNQTASLKKKICMLGAFAVGKTSLVARYVQSVFSDQYVSTVGAKTDKKVVTVEGYEITLVIWDVAGEDEFQKFKTDYLRGASGYLLVADGSRRATLDTAREIQRRAAEFIGPVPFVLAVNKADLENEWEITDADIEELSGQGWDVFKGSAKTGEGVEEMFLTLAAKTMRRQ